MDETSSSLSEKGSERTGFEGPARALPKELNKENAGEIECSDAALFEGVKRFEELNLPEELYKAIMSMGFFKPSKVQETIIPVIFANPPRNAMVQSHSGTGKTTIFALAMLYRVDKTNPALQALCLAPSRELAKQIVDVLNEMNQLTGIVIKEAVKEMNVRNGSKLDAQIVVGTPGTVMDFLQRRVLDPTQVKVFVLDEADNLLAQLEEHTSAVRAFIPKSAQLLFFSATWSDEFFAYGMELCGDRLATTVRLKSQELTLRGIRQCYIDCNGEAHKIEMLIALYGLLTVAQSMVFVRYKRMAEEIVDRMEAENFAVAFLHGDLTGAQRDHIMRGFRDGKYKVLVSTNVLARGIDVAQVNLIINVDLPINETRRVDPYIYLHRIGRTGRFGRNGVSIILVHDRASYDEMREMEKEFGCEILRVGTESFEILEANLKAALKGSKKGGSKFGSVAGSVAGSEFGEGGISMV
ncbi:DEAD-domain-containing protein [Chytriomyces sp. MP71]|nr:DEAD-domain-containing protein [Chytriomyces sp. MP71]